MLIKHERADEVSSVTLVSRPTVVRILIIQEFFEKGWLPYQCINVFVLGDKLMKLFRNQNQTVLESVEI